MTALTDFCAQINNWLNKTYDNTLITSWVRMADERLNAEMLIADMIQIADVDIAADNTVPIPSDWIALDFVRLVGGKPYTFISRHEYFEKADTPISLRRRYTINGNTLLVGGDDVVGGQMELTYYADIPPLNTDATFMSSRYNQLYMACTMVAGMAFGLEDDRASVWTQFATSRIASLNAQHMAQKVSGSLVRLRQAKGFG